MFGEKNLQIIETKWFDIIFPERSFETAKILFQHADKIYEEVYDSFDMAPFARMPIVLAPAVESLNAFFSSAPYNHIVFYDTMPDVGDGDSLAVFAENLCNIFRHECVHAVTFNLKNKAWQVVGSIFGDVINPAYLFVPPGLAEGTAVLIESADGEGRLNDSYSMQMVRQAKIENEFPSYADVQGASSIYPYGSHYQFNGAFYSWVRQKFGKEKFAQLWHKLVNFQTISTQLTFRAVYGMWITDAWQQFRDEYYVPDVAASPFENDAYADLFNFVRAKNTANFSAENRSGARYTSLTICENGFACVDTASGTVLFFEKNYDGSYRNPKVLFRRTGITRISFSRDGNLMAVSYNADSGATTKKHVAVYDMKRNLFFTLPETKLRDAAIVDVGGKNVLASVRVFSQNVEIVLFELMRSGSDLNGRITGVRQTSAISADYGSLFASPIYAGDSKIAYIEKQGDSWNIAVRQLTGGTSGSVFADNAINYKMPRDMVIRSLSWKAIAGENGSDSDVGSSHFACGEFLFSCAMPYTLPRLARLSVGAAGAELSVQGKDVSGGVLSPVAADDFGHVFYSGAFYRNSRLLCVDTARIDFEKVALAEAAHIDESPHESVNLYFMANNTDEIGTDKNFSTAMLEYDLHKYSPLKYYTRGIFLPLPLAQTYSFSGRNVVSNQILLGLTYASSNPWNGNIVIFSGGVRPQPFEVDMSVNFIGGTNTQLFKYDLKGNVAVDKKGFLQTFEQLKLSSSILFGRYMSLNLTDTFSFFYGRSAESKASFVDSLLESSVLQSALLNHIPFSHALHSNSLLLQNSFSAEISSIHKMRPSPYEYGGVSLAAIYNIDYGGLDAYIHGYELLQNLGATVTVRFPFILPIFNYNRHIYNLPGQASFSLFPTSTRLFSADATLVLYSYELQKAVPILTAIYVNRFTVFADYTGSVSIFGNDSWNILKTGDYFKMLANKELYYFDAISLRLQATLTPNFGMLSSAASINLTARFSWYLSPNVSDENRFVFNFLYSLLM